MEQGLGARPAQATTPPETASERGKPSTMRTALTLIGIAAVYYLSAKLSLRLSLVGSSVTPLWPPTGIALVGFLLLGYRVWPAVTVSAFLVNWPISPSVKVAAIIALGNTAAPAVAAGLLSLVRFRPELDRTRDAIALVVLGALGAMTVSATVGAEALAQSGALAITHTSYWSAWAVWWTGDAMGILAVAPFLLSQRTLRLKGRFSWVRAFEALVVFAALGATASLLHTTSRPLWVAVFPLLVWIAWRYQQRGSGPAALLVIMLASWAAARNVGPFTGTEILPKMVALQVFNAAVALTSFFFAAVVAERIAARREVERSAREMYMREHRIAETLQRSLLPAGLPDTPDIAIAARYIPAGTDVDVGGDWYDIISLPAGRIGFSIGDVAGHGVAAAAAMGQIRMALRAYGHESLSPAKSLDRLNVLIQQLQPGAMATLAYGQLDPENGMMTLAKAGHPPPLVVTSTGNGIFIGGGLAPPLGVSHALDYEEVTVELEPGSTLLLYTDGLIERRGESIATGMARLAEAVAQAPSDLNEAGDHIVGSLLAEGPADDVAMLMIRRLAMAGRPFRLTLPADPSRLSTMRQAFGRWLRRNAVDAALASEITLAATEACTNAIQHAYGSQDGNVDIDADVRDGTLTVVVRDYGTWRTPDPGAGGETGRGFELMRTLMDDVAVRRDDGGTEVRMTRRVGALEA